MVKKLKTRSPLIEARFLAQLTDVGTARLAIRIPDQTLFPRFQKLFAPPVILILVQALTPAQLRDTIFATYASQHDPNLLFDTEFPASRPFNVSGQLVFFDFGVLFWLHRRFFHLRG